MTDAAVPDHVQAAHARQVAIYQAMTPQQRIQQALRMNRTMRHLAAASTAVAPPLSRADIGKFPAQSTGD